MFAFEDVLSHLKIAVEVGQLGRTAVGEQASWG
jgi:hypothetical protein